MQTSRMSSIARWAWLVGVGVFMLAPLIFVIFYSFSNITYGVFPPPSYSLRWYRTLFTIAGFATALKNSVLIASVASVVATIAGTLAAYVVARRAVRLSEAIRAALVAPLVVPKIALSLAFFVLALRLGLYGDIKSLMLAHAVITLPLVIVIMAGAFVSVPRDFGEAAMDLGAGPMRSFVFVTLPQVRGALIVSVVLAFIVSFDEVETSLFLVRSNADPTIPITMFNYVSENQNPAPAALSVLLIGISLVVGGIAVYAVRRTGAFRTLTRSTSDSP